MPATSEIVTLVAEITPEDTIALIESVAQKASASIDAAPLEEQKYFLATQQVDEARHAIFFKRFMHEVVGAGDGSVNGPRGSSAGANPTNETRYLCSA